MPHVSFRSSDSDLFVVREVGDLTETVLNYSEGEYQLREADRLVCFDGVTPEELLKLGEWAESQFEEETVAFTGLESQHVSVRVVQGISGVHAYQRDRTGDAHGDWDAVQVPGDL